MGLLLLDLPVYFPMHVNKKKVINKSFIQTLFKYDVRRCQCFQIRFKYCFFVTVFGTKGHTISDIICKMRIWHIYVDSFCKTSIWWQKRKFSIISTSKGLDISTKPFSVFMWPPFPPFPGPCNYQYSLTLGSEGII